MKADLTRGHQPDAARGQTYRRVLLQQARLLLDSDWAAHVDAVDDAFRRALRELGCRAGSPDHGFIVTPGELLAFFDDFEHVAGPGPGDPFVWHRDYAHKYLERFPSLRLSAEAGAGAVTVQLSRKVAANTDVRLWYLGGNGLRVHLGNGQTSTINGNQQGAFAVVDLQTAAELESLVLEMPNAGAGREAWVGLVETRGSGAQPLWSTAGRYYADGLDVTQPEAAAYPAAGLTVANPTAPVANSTWVAYLEAWERHVTHADDAGLLERSLGGADTTTRTQTVGQVKLASSAATPDEVRAAFAAVDRGSAELEVKTAAKAPDFDVCAIPEAGGYTGKKNFLYRFEVHAGGDLGQASIKWSKKNGAEVFSVAEVVDPSTLRLGGRSVLRDGDLVEVTSERIALGDLDQGQVQAQAFLPPQRRVGSLFLVETNDEGRTLQLLDTNGQPAQLSVAMQADQANHPLSVRRWDGLVATTNQNPPPDVDLGDGVTIVLTGAGFQPGDYWQYEARVGPDNVAGWKKPPHGPERVFAPLAFLEYIDAPSPTVLHRWYGDWFPSLCALTADDVDYDGKGAGTDADTVQEAIDELYARETLCCCDATLDAEGAQDAQRIIDALDALPTGGVLCLEAGIYRLEAQVPIVGKAITIRGCPHTVVVSDVDAPAFRVSGGGHLTLEDTLVVKTGVSGRAVVEIANNARGLEARRAGLVQVGTQAPGYGVLIGDDPPDLSDPEVLPDVTALVPGGGARPAVALVESTVLARFAVAGLTASRLEVKDSLLMSEIAAIAMDELRAMTLSGSALDVSFGPALRGQVRGKVVELLATAIDRHELVAWLEATVEGALGQPVNGGVGLRVRRLFEGRARDCSVVAELPVWLSAAVGVRFTGNRYEGDRAAVRIDHGYDVALHEDSVAADVGVTVPMSAVDLSVVSLRAVGDYGVRLGASQPAEFRPFVRVAVRDCTLLSQQIGVHLAHPNNPQGLCDTRGVVVRGNVIEGARIGVFVTASGPGEGPDIAGYLSGSGPDWPTIEVADNHITSSGIGVLARGAFVQVTGNRVGVQIVEGLGAAKRPPAGILLESAQAARVQGNLVEVARTKGADVDLAGIRVDEGSHAVLSGNIVWGANDPTLLDLVGPHPHAVVQGNTFAGGLVRLEDVEQATLQGNEVQGDVLLMRAEDPKVSDNRVQGGLEVRTSYGLIHVVDNTVSKALKVLPATRYGPIWGVLEYLKDSFGKFTVAEAAVGEVKPATGRGRLSVFGEAYAYAKPVDDGGVKVDALEWASSPPMRTVVAAESVPKADVAKEVVLVMEGLLAEIGDVQVAVVARTEAIYSALVSANVAEAIQIGHAWSGLDANPPGGWPATAARTSRVQVIANQARAWMHVNKYLDLIALGNRAETVTGLTTQPVPINTLNAGKEAP